MTKERSKNRVVAGVVALGLGGGFPVGCSDDKPSAAPSSYASGDTQVSTSGSTEVKVGGSDQSGLAVVMTDEATSTVESGVRRAL